MVQLVHIQNDHQTPINVNNEYWNCPEGDPEAGTEKNIFLVPKYTCMFTYLVTIDLVPTGDRSKSFDNPRDESPFYENIAVEFPPLREITKQNTQTINTHTQLTIELKMKQTANA